MKTLRVGDDTTRDLLIECISINSSYSSQVPSTKNDDKIQVVPPREGEQQTAQLGNKTECALLGFVEVLGGSYQRIRDENPELSLFKVKKNNKLEIKGLHIQLCAQKYDYGSAIVGRRLPRLH